MSKLVSPTAALDAQATVRRHIADISQPAAAAAFSGHGFVIDSLGFLLPPQLKCEVLERLQPCPLPGTAAWLMGMVHVRGRIMPVFDLRRLLFPNESAQRPQRYLSIDPQQKGLALALYSMPFRLDLQEHQRLTRTAGIPEILLPFCSNLFHHDRVWIELDYKAFFIQQSQRLHNISE
ncbi:MAG TPA: chemotaxis protein CheW [Dongiaceae bacterium]|nr:chemotaxis protein CheW [Dongiaceae bacterium]